MFVVKVYCKNCPWVSEDALLVALVFFVTSVVEMQGKVIGVRKEEAFLLILCPFCLRNRSDGVKAINYLIGVIYLQV